MRQQQTVSEMAEEVLKRQAKALAARTDQPFEGAMETVVRTPAGRRLGDLANGERRDEGAGQWQAGLRQRRTEERRYSWVEHFMERLEGKEARARYYALLEEGLAGPGDIAGSRSLRARGVTNNHWRDEEREPGHTGRFGIVCHVEATGRSQTQ